MYDFEAERCDVGNRAKPCQEASQHLCSSRLSGREDGRQVVPASIDCIRHRSLVFMVVLLVSDIMLFLHH